MSADKRSVHTDALATLGTIITDKEQRDAIHLAVEPIQAGESLGVGMNIGIGKDGKAYSRGVKLVGIVDPFLDSIVEKGQWFWLIVYPRQITSLRHVWEHPDFENITGEAPKMYNDDKSKSIEESKEWIRQYAENLSGVDHDYDDNERFTITYDNLMETAMTWVEDDDIFGDFLVRGGLLEGVCTSPKFWEHFTNITGLKAPSETNFFSCSC